MVHGTAILPVPSGGAFGRGVEAEGGVILFLRHMPLGRKYLAIFTGVSCLDVLHRKISRKAGQGLSSVSPVP